MKGNLFFIRHFEKKGYTDHPLRQRLFLVGCDSNCDIVLPKKGAAPLAMKIEPCNGGYLCSAVEKGTLSINGRRVKSAVLVPGDSISIGKERFVFMASDRGSAVCTECEPSLFDNLRKFIEAVGREQRLKPLLRKLVDILSELTHHSDVFLFKLDHDGRPQVFESNSRGNADERFSDTIVQTVLERKEGICIPNALDDPMFRNSHSIADLKLRSILCTPILSAGKCLGVIYIGSSSPQVSFSGSDLDIVSTYASITGMLINHIDLIADQQSTIDRFSGAVEFDGIIAASPSMRSVLTAAQAIAPTDVTVLIEGETGSGKNRIAELIHGRSRRASAPFIVVNCSALHGELLESELFGHRIGSFTGAIKDHDGLFKAARGGTLLLDEIGELEPQLQAKLLRVLESGAVRPIGSSSEEIVDVRIICATNRSLKKMVEENRFRADLFYRINRFSITVPPLRERGDDVVLLAYSLLNRYRSQYPDREIRDFHPRALKYIRSHNWPGNIRELDNVVHRAVLMSQSPLIDFDIPPQMESETTDDFEEATRRFQRDFLEQAIRNADGNKELAARNIGLSRSTFYRYLAQLKI